MKNELKNQIITTARHIQTTEKGIQTCLKTFIGGKGLPSLVRNIGECIKLEKEACKARGEKATGTPDYEALRDLESKVRTWFKRNRNQVLKAGRVLPAKDENGKAIAYDKDGNAKAPSVPAEPETTELETSGGMATPDSFVGLINSILDGGGSESDVKACMLSAFGKSKAKKSWYEVD